MEEKAFKDMAPEELVKHYVFPHGLSEEEKTEMERDMKTIRLRLLNEITEAQQIYGDLIRLRLAMERYVQEGACNPENSFGSYLKEYIRLVRKPQKEFSSDIGLHPTKLSRVLNDRDDPNVPLMYRLEKYSGGKIPAILWWKILMKKTEDEIVENEEGRREEEAKVKNGLKFDFVRQRG